MSENPHAQSPEELAKAVGTDLKKGLSETEAAERLKKHGPNELPKEKKRSVILLFLKQFHSILNYVLFAAAALSLAMGHASDVYGILIAILIRAVIGFVQERKAEAAIEKLRDLVVQEATVLRDGQEKRIPSRDLAPGDVLVIQEGDRIVADARVFEAKDLQVAEASLTGESTPASKTTDAMPAEASIGDRRNMVFMGTNAVAGLGKALVVETGGRTVFGGIADSLRTIKHEKTPFEVRVDSLGKRLGVLSIGLSFLVFLVGWLRGFPFLDMVLFGVAMVVSVVPEGLPAVLAIVLAIGVQRMAKRNAVIRHIPSVETLGFADIICTDKTGTLTENKMTVRELITDAYAVQVAGEGWETTGDFTLDGRRFRPTEERQVALLLTAASLCTRASLERKENRISVVGDPTEGALVVAAAKAGLDKKDLAMDYPLADEIPFSSDRKYRAVLVSHQDLHGKQANLLFVVGAFEVVKGKSGSALVNGDSGPFDDGKRARFDKENQRMAEKAMRVLAVAMKVFPPEKRDVKEEDVTDLTFLGLVGMIDPPRQNAASAIARCTKAGVRVIMITGDQKATAIAIGKEIGLLPKDGGEAGKVFTDSEIGGLPDDKLKEILQTAAVLARVSPQTKLRIVTLLQAEGHIVAMTGDGVNDAPALKKASIGVAMGITGTDVSKEVADMVLTDDNFESIVNAIEEGRLVFRNVKQTTAYLFMTNVGEVVTVLVSLIMGLPLPLLPAQILWMNLITDGFPDVALATEGMHGKALDEPPRRKDTAILSRNVFMLTLLTSAVMCGGTLALFMRALGQEDIVYARTIAFTTMAMFQLWNVFNMRSGRQSLFSIGFFTNTYVLLAVSASVALQMAVLYVPSLQAVFGTKAIGFADWGIIIAVTSSVFVAVEGYKVLIRREIVPKSWT